MTKGLALLYEPTPDEKDIFVSVKQSIREPRSQLIR